MERPKLSESQEDYLKEIFKLQEKKGKVSTLDLADKLKVKPPSVTGMIKKLNSLNLVKHEPYKGVQLTPTGEKIALEVIRHHRLIELYLSRHLNYSWDEIHQEAERLEHFISEKFEAAIAEKMNHPTHDPHGEPIPALDLTIPESPDMLPLTAFVSGKVAVIGKVTTQDKDFLNLLSRLELTIGQRIEVAGNDTGGIRIIINSSQFLIPNSIAGYIWCRDN